MTYNDQFYYAYNDGTGSYQYWTRYLSWPDVVSYDAVEHDHTVQTQVAHNSYADHDMLPYTGNHLPSQFKTNFTRNTQLDLKEPHQNITFYIPASKLEHFEGRGCWLDFEGGLNSDTTFDDYFDVTVDLAGIFGAATTWVFTRATQIGPYTKRFVAAAVGVVAQLHNVEAYKINLIIRARHAGTVNQNTDILCFNFGVRLTVGSGISRWFTNRESLTSQTHSLRKRSASSCSSWEEV